MKITRRAIKASTASRRSNVTATGEMFYTNENHAIYDSLKRMFADDPMVSVEKLNWKYGTIAKVVGPNSELFVLDTAKMKDSDKTGRYSGDENGRYEIYSNEQDTVAYCIDYEGVIHFFEDWADGKVNASTKTRKTRISAAYDKTRQKLQDACEGFIGRKADDVLDELDSMGFSDHSSSPVREDGDVVGRREVFWSSSYDTDIVIEYDKQTEEVYNAYTEETKDNQAGVGAATKTAKRPIKAARTETIQYLNFDELSDEQKDQAVRWMLDEGPAYAWYSDDAMFWYKERVNELASDLQENFDVEANTDKLYWQESSQGPYPEWKLDQVFGEQDYGGYSIVFYGESTTVYADCYDESGDEMSSIPEDAQAKIDAVQQFINDVWSAVEDTCRSYPDEEWVYGALEANNYEFRVDNDGNVVSMA